MDYGPGSRELQDAHDTRRLADRLAERSRTALSAEDRAYLAARDMMFLATADADGRPTCSYKGGLPGFVAPLDDTTVAWRDVDGNGMFLSLGNMVVNPWVGLLFIDFEAPSRLRIHGRAGQAGRAAGGLNPQPPSRGTVPLAVAGATRWWCAARVRGGACGTAPTA